MNESSDTDDPPPMLNWEEREAGQPGQLSLPGFADAPTLAERVFLQLARRWYIDISEVAHDHPTPRPVDELALATLLLAREHGPLFTNVVELQATENLGLAQTRNFSSMECLPWRLVIAARQSEPGLSSAAEELRGNLDHHRSALRLWIMQLAWVVRPWLRREDCLPPLLTNVANNVCGVETAWGLAATLFRSAEEFYATADRWIPKNFTEQYARRVALLKERGRTTAQASLWKMEASCRFLIADTALSATCPGARPS